MGNVRYDRRILQARADQLYSEAATVQLWAGIKWGLLLGIVVFAIEMAVAKSAGFPTLIVFAIGGLCGYAGAADRAYRLRFEAQELLLRMQIEENTAVSAGVAESLYARVAPQPVIQPQSDPRPAAAAALPPAPERRPGEVTGKRVLQVAFGVFLAVGGIYVFRGETTPILKKHTQTVSSGKVYSIPFRVDGGRDSARLSGEYMVQGPPTNWAYVAVVREDDFPAWTAGQQLKPLWQSYNHSGVIDSRLRPGFYRVVMSGHPNAKAWSDVRILTVDVGIRHE